MGTERVDIYVEGHDGLSKPLAESNKSLDKLEQNAKQASKAVGGMGNAIQDMSKMAMGFATGQLLTGAVEKLGGAFMDSIKAASDLNESTNKMKVVFGDAAGAVESFGATSATSVGLSKQAAYEATATFGNLFGSMGLGKKVAGDMSMEMIKLAADLASFNNISLDEALLKLRSGLVGEAEPMRTVGVLLNETTVKAKAMQMGFKEVSGELTEAQKVQARYALILEQTKTAQGDFKNTSGDLANSQRIAQAELANASAELGKSFLPVMLLATKAAVGFAHAIEGWAFVFQQAGAGIKWLGDRLGELGGKATEAAELSTEAGAKAAAGIGKVTATLSNKVQLEWETMQRQSGNALDQLSFKFVESLSDMQQSHSDKLGRIAEDEAKATRDLGNQLAKRLETYNANQADMQEKHDAVMIEIDRAEQKATAEFTGQVMQRETKWDESMADLATSHAKTIDGIKAKMAGMQAQFVADANARKQKYDEEKEFAADTYEDEKARHEAKSKDILEKIKNEGFGQVRGTERLVGELRRRYDEEKALANLSYDEYLARIDIRQAEAEKAAKDKADKELATVNAQLAEEDTAFAVHTAKLKDEYDKDVRSYKSSLTTKYHELQEKGREETIEFEKRTAKAKDEYDKDVVDYQNAWQEKADEFAKRRLEEDTAFIADMSKRRQRYDEDVGAVRSAEAKKLKLVEERLAAEYAANVEQVAKLRDLTEPGHEVAEPSGPGLPGPMAPGTGNTRKYPSYHPGMASGGIGTVSQPTMFLAGEAGRESFWFSGANNNVPPPGQSIDYDRLASALQSQPIVLRIDSEDVVVRGYERARRRGRIA